MKYFLEAHVGTQGKVSWVHRPGLIHAHQHWDEQTKRYVVLEVTVNGPRSHLIYARTDFHIRRHHPWVIGLAIDGRGDHIYDVWERGMKVRRRGKASK